jgi:hydrogenase nickel incorporation protein HypA/HybF
MHELAICQALMKQIQQVSDLHGSAAVCAVQLKIGALAGIEPELLKSAFSLVREGTCANSSVLEIEDLPIRIYCAKCDQENSALVNNLTCPLCKNWQTRLVSGDEMLLSSVDLEKQENHYV